MTLANQIAAQMSQRLDAYYRVIAAKRAYKLADHGFRNGHWKALKDARTAHLQLGEPVPQIQFNRILDMVV